MKYFLLLVGGILGISLINCSFNEAMLPSMPNFQTLSPLISLIQKNQTTTPSPPVTVSSNHTIQINTTNMDPLCTPECYLNCQAHFLDITEQKYCIINVCKCEVIGEGTSIQNSNPIQINNTNSPKPTFLISNIINTNKKEKSLLFPSFNLIFLAFLDYEFWAAFFICSSNNKNISLSDNKNYYGEDGNLYQKLISDEKEEEDNKKSY